jgi:hypothetical protein
MLSVLHEALVRLFRERPELAPELLRDALGMELPADSEVRVESADFTQIAPADYRADLQFTAKDITLRGSIEIRESSIDIDLEVPFLLRPFKDKALGVVEREIGLWVDKARRGEV